MSDKVTRTTRITTRASRRSDTSQNNTDNVHQSTSLLSTTDESPNNSYKKRKLSSQPTGSGDGNRNKMNRSLEPDSDINNDTESNCSSQPDLGVSNGSLKRSTRLRKHSSKYTDYATFENNSNASSSHSNGKKLPKQQTSGSKTVKEDQDSSNLLPEAFFGSDLAKDSSSNEETIISHEPVVVKTSNVGRPRSRPSNTNIHSARSSRSNNSLSNNEEPSIVEPVKDYEIIRVNTNTTTTTASEPKSPITPIKIKISRNKDNSSTVSTISPIEPVDQKSAEPPTIVKQVEESTGANDAMPAIKSSSLKLNLGELVRNCKSKLGIQKDNEEPEKEKKEEIQTKVEETREEENGDVASGDENVDNASVLAVVNAIASSERLSTSPQKQPTVKSDTRKNNELKRKKYLDEIKATYEQLFKEIKLNTDIRIREILNESNWKILKMKNEHERAIKEIKSKQWCANCGSESFYYCCWNTSYCSEKCQKEHWNQHYKNCLRINPSLNDEDEIMNGSSGMYMDDEVVNSYVPINMKPGKTGNSGGYNDTNYNFTLNGDSPSGYNGGAQILINSASNGKMRQIKPKLANNQQQTSSAASTQIYHFQSKTSPSKSAKSSLGGIAKSVTATNGKIK